MLSNGTKHRDIDSTISKTNPAPTPLLAQALAQEAPTQALAQEAQHPASPDIPPGQQLLQSPPPNP